MNLRFMFFIYILITLVSSFSYCQTYIMTVRNSENLLDSFCKTTKCEYLKLDKSAKEFANGNTFVKFKQNIAQKDILIVIPPTIDYNQFLELLINIRTAKSEFAASVSVKVMPTTQNKINVIDNDKKIFLDENLVLEFLDEAGADKFNSSKIKSQKIPQYSQTNKSVIVDQGTNSKLAKEMAENLGVPILTFDEAMLHLKYQSLNVILISSVKEPHNLSFLEALDQVRKIKKMGSRVTLVTPYLPYARSDKKDQKGVSVIGRLAADLIERSGVNSVQFVRAHAPQSQGFFKIPSIQTMGRTTINTYLRSQGVEQIISPDAGFQKDATLYADDLSVPVSVINKQRDLETGESKLHDMSGPNVAGKTVAIIDDETASGGTLAKAAEFLKQQGAKRVIAVVTHLAGNASQAIDSPFLDEIAVTNTFEIDNVNDKLKVLSIASEISTDLKLMLNISSSCAKAYKD